MSKKHKILFVDDELQWNSSVRETLGNKFDIITASTAADAVHAIETMPDFKAVVVDINLSSTGNPKNDQDIHAGFNLIDKLEDNIPNIPIIVMSSFAGKLDFEPLSSKDYISTFVDKSNIPFADNFTAKIEETIEQSIKKDKIVESEKLDKYSDLKNLLKDEIEKYSEIKERSIHIPDEGHYRLIKPLIGYKRDLEKQISEFPFEKNVFLMMKFRTANKDLSDFIIETLNRHGLNGVRADQAEWNITKNVYNPIATLYCCKYGIALFDEPEDHQAYSPNVAYELGMMHYQGKECLILKNAALPEMPFDLIKDLYETYDKDLQVRKIVEKWVSNIT